METGLGPGRLVAFLVRRGGRILPAYLVIIGMVTLASTLFSGRSWISSPFPIWTYLTFTQDVARIYGDQGRWLEPTWTLAVEEQFYLLLPLLLVLPRRVHAPTIVSLIFVSIAFRSFIMASDLPDSIANNTLPGKMDLLLCGVFAAWARRNLPCERLLPALRIGLAPAIMVAVLLFLLRGLDAFAIWGMAPIGAGIAAFLLAISLGAPEFRSVLSGTPLRFLGAVSFGLYLYHQPINVLFHGLMFESAPALGSSSRWIPTGAALIVSILLAAVSLRFVETPLLRTARNWADGMGRQRGGGDLKSGVIHSTNSTGGKYSSAGN